MEPKKRKRIEVQSHPVFDIKALPESTPASVKALCRLAQYQMSEDDCPSFDLGSKLFGNHCKTFLGQKDIFDFATMKEISSGSILIYLR